jgi:hypothetical protein
VATDLPGLHSFNRHRRGSNQRLHFDGPRSDRKLLDDIKIASQSLDQIVRRPQSNNIK